MRILQRWREQDLLQRVRDGDREAADHLVDRHYESVYRWLLHLCRDAERAADLTQETFVHAWEGIGSFRGDSSFRTWLHRIAYHAYLRARSAADPEFLALSEVLEEPSQTAIDLTRRMVADAMAQLSPGHREVVILHYLQGFTCEEIARTLEIPPGTVLSRLHTARNKLRPLLSEDPCSPATREVHADVARD